MRVICNDCIIAEKERSGGKNTYRFSTLLLMGCHAMYFFPQNFMGSSLASFTRTVTHENDREPYPKNLTGPLNPL
jgi:hypothetical protein